MTRDEFVALLRTMEEGWNTLDAAKVANCFSEAVVYADPLRYRFSSRANLLRFFELPHGETQSVTWHALLFDEREQAGAAEYTYTGSYIYHGLVLIRVRDGVVSEWREYQHTSELPWEEFIRGGEMSRAGGDPS